MSRKLHALTTTIALLATGTLAANDIQIGNASLVDNDNGTGTVMVQFDVSWENSWRTNTGPSNWDAAWLFVKFRTAGGEWQHARLEGTGHVAPSGTTIDAGLLTPGSGFNITTNPAVGVFLYRSAVSSGSLSANGTKLKWNYAANGVTYGDIAQIKVFGIEMVYVPSGAFSLGSGGTESESFTDGSWTSGSSIPLQVTSENSLPIGQAPGSLWTTSGSPNSLLSILPTQYPKGFEAFYSMKYEITQQGYTDFLNTLTETQQTNRWYSISPFGFLANRNGIKRTGNPPSPLPFVYSSTSDGGGSPWLACNYLSWNDVLAYLDWSGLRPMTELEYEKLCRGTVTPVPNEFAWGSTQVNACFNAANAGLIDESCAQGDRNVRWNSIIGSADQGPIRVGAFATPTADRQTAGAGYYGVMELTGNLWEQVIGIHNGFTGAHGNGVLSSSGDQDASWPGSSAARIRGGSWGSSTLQGASERDFTGSIGPQATGRLSSHGGRGVRNPF